MSNKRNLQEVLRGLMGKGFYGSQKDLCEELKRQGYTAHQSNVSRNLKKMGVIKKSHNGQSYYALPSQQEQAPPIPNDLKSYILDIQHNGHTIVLKTHPGAAMFIAGFIDHDLRQGVMGTIAGDDTIFALPRNVKEIGLITLEIKNYFQMSS